MYRLAWLMQLEPNELHRMIFGGGSFDASDVWIPEMCQEPLKNAIRIPREQLERMTLLGFAQPPRTTFNGHKRALIPKSHLDPNDRGPSKIRYCPECLATTGIWRLEWRQPWVFHCPLHHCLLRSRCHRCDGHARLINRSFWPRGNGRPLGPDRCWNTRDGRKGSRAEKTVCGARLGSAFARRIDRDQELSRSLSRLRELMVAGRTLRVGGVERGENEFLGDLAWLLNQLERYPSQIVGRPSYGGGSRTADHPQRTPLTEDVASWLPVALFILEQPDEETMTKEFEHVMKRCFGALREANYERWADDLRPKKVLVSRARNKSSPLYRAVISLREGAAMPSVRTDRSDGLRTIDRSVEPRHIPELLRPEVIGSFRERLKFDRFQDFELGSALSVVARQALRDRERPSGLSRFVPERNCPHRIRPLDRQICSCLRATFTDDELFSALTNALQRNFALGCLVDFEDRLNRFEGWSGIDPKSWSYIEESAPSEISSDGSNSAWHHCSHEVRLRATGSRGAGGPPQVSISRKEHEAFWAKFGSRFQTFTEAYLRSCVGDPHLEDEALFDQFVEELSRSSSGNRSLDEGRAPPSLVGLARAA